jgi:hypothetical protein
VRIYNRFIISLALLLALTTVIMAAYGQSRLDIYLTIFLIETLALTELYVYLNPKARRSLGIITGVLFLGFVALVVLEVYKIISG